jgi:hypothetical protein
MEMTWTSRRKPARGVGVRAPTEARVLAEISPCPVAAEGITSIWEIEAETYREQSNYPRKVYVIQRMRLVEIRGTLLLPDIGGEGR